MSLSQLILLLIPGTIGGTIGTITSLNDEIKTLRRYNFRVVPDVFQIGCRITFGTGTGAISSIIWPIHIGLSAYNFIDEQSKLG